MSHRILTYRLHCLRRAISVLLGEAWKNLSLDEREQYSQKAKILADEQKKLFPDCWKRKRTITSAHGQVASGGAKPSSHSGSSPQALGRGVDTGLKASASPQGVKVEIEEDGEDADLDIVDTDDPATTTNCYC